ncbi:MAG: hypothetical protein WBM17_12965 [Anaerolineales bacterium]
MKSHGNLITFLECLAIGLIASCSPGVVPAEQSGTPVDLPAQNVSNPTPALAPTLEPIAPAQPVLRAIAAGWGYTLALTGGGAVKCWGSGYMCDGSTVNKSAPVDKPELTGGVAAVSAGGMHACALMEGGGVKCWGENNFGQLGNDTRTDSSAPVDVAGLSSGVMAVAAGGSHTCALMEGGGVKCWGQNDSGQLGDGTLNVSRTPVDVSGLAGGVRAIAAGGTHTCALMESGTVKCWGFNGNGQLGNSDTDSPEGRYRSTPADVQGLTDAVEVAAGFAVTCARTGGGVKCWGQRGNGQLGDGLPPDGEKQSSSIPVDVIGLPGQTAAIAVGMSTSCAVAAAGSVFCWGVGTGAEDPATQNISFAPVPVSGLSDGAAAVSAGEMHVCVLTGAGAVKCWGKNAVGQLGDGTTNDSAVPVDVLGLV